MIGFNISDVRRLCETGDGVAAAHQIRWGATSAGLACAPPPIEATSRFTWREVRRLPQPGPSLDAACQAALAGLWGAGTGMAMLVAAEEHGPARVYLGTTEGALGLEWMQSMLGPGASLAQISTPHPAALSRLLHAPVGSQRALGIKLVPSQMPAVERPDQDEPGAVPLLGRLLSLPDKPFTALITCLPVPPLQLDQAYVEAEQALDAARRHVSVSLQTTEATSVTQADSAMSRAADALDLLLMQLRRARSSGGWVVDVILGGESERALSAVAGAAAGGIRVPGSFPADRVVDELVVDPAAQPGGSFLCSEELVALVTPPAAGIGGLEVLKPPPSSVWHVPVSAAVNLGHFSGSPEQFQVDLDDLAAHVFVTGLTGSGKSTTLWRLLTQAWNIHGVPFLLIDPVKSEHEALGGVVRDGLSVVKASNLRMNVLAPYPGFDGDTHLGLASTVFRGCFSLPTPVPYMVRLLFERLGSRAGPVSLHDVRAELEPLADELGYAGEVDSNIRAALGSRLAVLTSPRSAIRLCAPDQTQITEMLRRPTLIELAEVGDDDERAFLMAMLTVYVMEAARSRPVSGTVSHITVLEEAHRVLPEPRATGGDGSVEGGDAASAVSRLLVQMLAEARGFGESLVVVDQSPGALARDVVRNTGLKLVHRTVDPADREVVGGALGLDTEQSEPLAYLEPGEAVIAGRRILSPQTIRVARTRPPAERLTSSPPASGRWPCCDGGPEHQLAERDGAEAELAVSLLCAAVLTDAQPQHDPVESLRRKSSYGDGACLFYVGLRRYLRSLTDCGQLSAEDYEEVLRRLYEAYRSPGLADVIASVLRPSTELDVLPFAGCSDCRSQCVMQAVTAGPASVQSRRLVGLLARAQPQQEPAIATSWADQVRHFYAPNLGDRAADLTLCLLLRVLAKTGRAESAEPFLGRRA